MRNLDSRQVGVVIEDLKAHQLEDVLIDEAYALGVFHRTYFSQTDEFENALDMLNPDDIVDFVHKLSKEFKDNLKELKQNLKGNLKGATRLYVTTLRLCNRVTKSLVAPFSVKHLKHFNGNSPQPNTS
ncbi:MAG: hypothetical protein H7281_12655 [Bacteriovorax sp.]|nr:hypothetical protein [Bacteriovorax sp.]